MRRRKTRRRKAKRNKQIIIISTMCLLFCLCAGYAAFQTNISITAKGNAFCSGQDATDKMIADSFVESGSGLSGLYEDSYETGRYVYRGASVNNYITFDGEPWRIIAIESDGTLKIMRNERLDSTFAFDTSGYRDSGSGGAGGTYCAYGSYGCNVWAATENMVGTPSEFTSADGSYSGTVSLDSSLNTYLNGDYYNDLSSTAQSYIVSYTYNIGSIYRSSYESYASYTIEDQLAEESKYKWIGKVALINLSDYIRSNSSDENSCNMLYGSYVNYATCSSTTWMYNGSYYWTITPRGSYTDWMWYVTSDGRVTVNTASGPTGVRPVVHLTSDLKLCGSGTEEDPYTIVG